MANHLTDPNFARLDVLFDAHNPEATTDIDITKLRSRLDMCIDAIAHDLPDWAIQLDVIHNHLVSQDALVLQLSEDDLNKYYTALMSKYNSPKSAIRGLKGHKATKSTASKAKMDKKLDSLAEVVGLGGLDLPAIPSKPDTTLSSGGFGSSVPSSSSVAPTVQTALADSVQAEALAIDTELELATKPVRETTVASTTSPAQASPFGGG